MMVMNSLRDKNAGFGFDTNKVSVFFKDGTEKELQLADKKEIAEQIVQLIIQKTNA
jgi:phosphopantothenoylcysteine decarboxylase/phosphopantothenate--cysteine ligase